MRRPRGLHDIKTHGTLAREGQLVSVARDLHRISSKGATTGHLDSGSWDGKVTSFLYKKPAAQRTQSPGGAPLFPGERIRTELLRIARDEIKDMRKFAEEGISGARAELERLEARLSRLILPTADICVTESNKRNH